jgi:hypothetical protein
MELRRGRRGPQYAKAAFMTMASLILIGGAYAADPAAPTGYITVARDVPQHNAFRAGDLGHPTNVATAREDVVVAGTRLRQPTLQALPDSALDDVGIQTAAKAPAGLVAVVGSGAGSAMRSMGATMGRSASPIGSAMASTIPGGAGMRIAGSLGSVLPAMPGVK